MKFSLLARVFLFILDLAVSGPIPAAQTQDSAPAPAAPGENLADLKKHPAWWPIELKVKTSVRLAILKDGVKQGSVIAPAGSMVQLVSINETVIQVGVGPAQASVSPDQTDLWERIARSSPPPSSPPAPSAAVVTNPSVTTPAPAEATSGQPQTFDYEAKPNEGFSKAAFHFWSPAYTKPLRGIIIMVPGADADGRSMVDDAAWQALARKYRLALVGCFLQGKGYHDPRRGTGDALRDALKDFATKSNRPEVATTPMLLWGISAGGQFNYNYTIWKPDNVMAFVVNKGGYYNDVDSDTHSRSVPGLFFLGQTDESFRISAITHLWTEGRMRGALWALAPQPNSGHEFSKTDAVARVFFEAVLKARLPDENAPPDGPSMNAIQENQGWLGNLTTHEIHDGTTDADPDRHAAWLPDESTAQAWKTFVSGG